MQRIEWRGILRLNRIVPQRLLLLNNNMENTGNTPNIPYSDGSTDTVDGSQGSYRPEGVTRLPMPFPVPKPHPPSSDNSDDENSSPAQENSGDCIIS